jgi:spermidine/putrescine-binding protein
MNTTRFTRLAAGMLALSIVLIACARASPPTAPPQPTSESASPASLSGFVSRPSGHSTVNGFACPEPQPRAQLTSTEINVFLWTEYIPPDIVECFEKVYGVTVNREEFSSNEELIAKLQAGAAGYDIVHPSDYAIDVLARLGLLQKLDKGRLPNLGNIGADYFTLYGDSADYISPYQVGTQAIVYNSETIINPPAAWADLWKPEYADRMVFVDDTRVIIGMTLLTQGYSVNATDAAQLEQAQAKLAELAPNVKLWDSDSPKTALIAGDADLGVVWNGEAYLAARELPSLKYIIPTEGAILFEDGFAIPAEAPHLDAAYAWMNYLLQPDVAWLLIKDYPYTVPNIAALEFAKDNPLRTVTDDGEAVTVADLYTAYAQSNITNTPVAELLKGHNVEDVGAALTLYDRIWTEVKGGN